MESGLHEEHEPEMRRVPLTSLVLQIKLSKFGTPKGLLVIGAMAARDMYFPF